MSKRANRLFELRRNKRKTQRAVALELNMSQSTMSIYENSDVIPSDILHMFAQYYGVSMEYIMCFTDDKSSVPTTGLNKDEHNILSFYRSLKEEYKKLFIGIISLIKNVIDSNTK